MLRLTTRPNLFPFSPPPPIDLSGLMRPPPPPPPPSLYPSPGREFKSRVVPPVFSHIDDFLLFSTLALLFFLIVFVFVFFSSIDPGLLFLCTEAHSSSLWMTFLSGNFAPFDFIFIFPPGDPTPLNHYTRNRLSTPTFLPSRPPPLHQFFFRDLSSFSPSLCSPMIHIPAGRPPPCGTTIPFPHSWVPPRNPPPNSQKSLISLETRGTHLFLFHLWQGSGHFSRPGLLRWMASSSIITSVTLPSCL